MGEQQRLLHRSPSFGLSNCLARAPRTLFPPYGPAELARHEARGHTTSAVLESRSCHGPRVDHDAHMVIPPPARCRGPYKKGRPNPMGGARKDKTASGLRGRGAPALGCVSKYRGASKTSNYQRNQRRTATLVQLSTLSAHSPKAGPAGRNVAPRHRLALTEGPTARDANACSPWPTSSPPPPTRWP